MHNVHRTFLQNYAKKILLSIIIPVIIVKTEKNVFTHKIPEKSFSFNYIVIRS